MTKTVTTDAKGGVLQTAIADASFTVMYSRKLGRENYGNEELSIYCQLPVADGTSLVDIEAQVNEMGAFAKAWVLKGLGRDVSVSEGAGPSAIVDSVDTKVQRPAAVTESRDGASTPTKDSLWEELLENPDHFFDNRKDKRNPRAPDFKRKKSGEGLWLDSKDTPPAAKLLFSGTP